MGRTTEPLPRSLIAAIAAVLAALVAGMVLRGEAEDPRPPGAGVGEERTYGAALADPVPYDGRSPVQPPGARERVLVELPRPALGELADLATMDAQARRQYVLSLQEESRALRSALAARGVRLREVVTYERAWHGFAATIRAGDLPGLQSLGVRVRPVRRFYPALSEPVPLAGEPAPQRAPAACDRAVTLLGGGVGRAADRPPGYDAVERDGDPAPAADPRAPDRVEVGGEPIARLLADLGACVRVVRVSALRTDPALPAAEEFGRTDELLDAFEHVVDRDGDGDTADHDAVAVLAVAAPYAGFANAPEAQAVAAAQRLGTLVVAPAGHEGPGTRAFGTLASPAAAPASVAVTALSHRDATPRTRLTVGPVTVADAALLGGAPPSRELATGPVISATDAAELLRAGTLQGRLAVVRAGSNPGAQAAAAAAAGAAAVLLAQPLERPLPAIPAGRVGVPVIGVTGAAARAILEQPAGTRAAARGARRGGTATPTRVSRFASRGPSFAGLPKPDLARAASAVAGGHVFAGAAVAAARVAFEAAALEEGDPAAARKRLVAAANALRRELEGRRPPARRVRVPLGTMRLRREQRSTGVDFTVGSFERGDPAAGEPTRIIPALRLELTLEDGAGAAVQRLTPPGGQRGVLPAQYAYTLPARLLDRLAAGSYRFRARAWAPRQRLPSVTVSRTFEVP